MNPLPIVEDDLHAYVDGALTPERHAEVEAWLATHPADAERVLDYQAHKLALKALFNPVIEEALPETLQALSVQPLRASSSEIAPESGSSAVNPKNAPKMKMWWAQRLAAGVLIAVLGGMTGWLARGQWPVGEQMAGAVPLPRQAAVAHVVYSPDARRPVEVSADQEEALVKWLSKRLGTPVKPPALGTLGYELIGGRLLPGNSGPVAQFMYQEASGQRLTLYVTTESTEKRDTGFRFAREGQVNVFYWVDGKFGYALSAAIDRGELAKVATAVYDQLEQK